MSIVVTDLLKIYGTQKAVNHISFSVQKGEIVGFLGPNGAGKSTTMKMLTGYLVPDAGAASICGLDVTANPLEVKRKIGYLPEANPLYYDMYVREYLSFVAGVHQINHSAAHRAKQIEDIIQMTGLINESKKKTGQLSKGYKQRVGLAAALIHDPEVLILDEPTSGLDPNQIIEIRNLIKQQGQNKTVLFSSHILQEVEAVCDRVIIIHHGELVADDTLKNLQQNRQSNMVKVSFKETVLPGWLQNLPGVQSVSQLNDQSWQLITSNTTETRNHLLQLALNENLNIVSLQTGGNNLEEIFRTLTQTAQ